MKAFAISDRGLPRRSLDEYRMGNPYDGLVKQDGGWHLSYYMSAAGDDLSKTLSSSTSAEIDLHCHLVLPRCKTPCKPGKPSLDYMLQMITSARTDAMWM